MGNNLGWNFTADSEIQMQLSNKMKEHADQFDEKIKELYDQIDSMGSNNYWVGEDYEAFNTGCHNYSDALKDLSDSFRMFADHFAKVSDGTVDNATDFCNIIKNITTIHLGEVVNIAPSSLEEIGGDFSTTTASSSGNGTVGDFPTEANDGTTDSSANTTVEKESFWRKFGGRYADDWKDFTGDVSQVWANANGFLSGTYAVGATVNEFGLFVGDSAVNTVEGVVDGVDYGINFLFDLGTGRGGSTTGDYWANIGQDYAENWDYSNVTNIWGGVAVTAGGIVRTVVDVGQTGANAATTAVDWVCDGVSWLGDKYNDLCRNVGGYFLG